LATTLFRKIRNSKLFELKSQQELILDNQNACSTQRIAIAGGFAIGGQSNSFNQAALEVLGTVFDWHGAGPESAPAAG
jgi:hypothetical protein